jgi:dihydrofolate synthase/folylpolyglutamate synthase
MRSGIAIAAGQAPEAAAVLLRRSEEANVPLLVEGRDLAVHVGHRDLAGQILTFAGPGWELREVILPMLGTYQPANALLAVAAARELGATDAAIRQGLDRVRWPGRFQIVGRGPWLVLDGAHNPAGGRALAASLHEFFGERPLTLIAGVLRDKKAAGILAALVPLARRVILTGSSNPRSSSPADLVALMPAGSQRPELAASVSDALAMAGTPSDESVTCVAGSLSLVGDALAHLAGSRDTPCPIEKGTASMSPAANGN